jgi:hypothetical protein
MKRARVLGCAVLVLAPVVLAAGCTGDPTPSGVTVAWADRTYRTVRVTWQEDGDAPNKVAIEGVVTESPSFLRYTKVGEPNTVLIPASAFPVDGNYRVAVTVGTSAGGSTSKPGVSAMFDTDGPARPVVTAIQPGRDGLVLVRWRPSSPPEDFTPGDPLDVPRQQQTFTPAVGVPGAPLRTLGPASTATQRWLAGLRPPYLFQLRASNEWGSVWAGQMTADTSNLSAQIPRLAAYGAPMLVRGWLLQRQVRCGPTRCSAHTVTSAGLPVILHARERDTGSWRAVGGGTTRGGGYYVITSSSPGTRQYRVVAPTTVRSSLALLGSFTSVVTTQTVARPTVYGFRGGNVKLRGQAATAFLQFVPAVTSRAMLQYWAGTGWRNLGWLPVRAGQASLTFGATRPGTIGYRFVVPSMAYGGRPIGGFSTGSFVLVTR